MFNKVMILVFAACGSGYLAYAVYSGRLWIEGYDKPILRQSRPVVFWLVVLFFATIFGFISWSGIRQNFF